MPLILPKPGVFEHEEKRSRFLAYCAPVENEDAAKRVVAEIRAAHPKANHNVFAYSVAGIPVASAGKITRSSDDGEPHGTAGMPVLNVFVKADVIDFVCVVTRYFGGTLLGAGGLVRAYTRAAKGAMENAAPTELVIYKDFRVVCPYSNFDKVKYSFEKLGVEILNVTYTDVCTLDVRVKEALVPQFLREEGFGAPSAR
ncbi:MAG: YigZ family protein [Defluviitaleaceae bacterium]|nr:YigZ family protein [Defluviitaleaceae bacterium]